MENAGGRKVVEIRGDRVRSGESSTRRGDREEVEADCDVIVVVALKRSVKIMSSAQERICSQTDINRHRQTDRSR